MGRGGKAKGSLRGCSSARNPILAPGVVSGKRSAPGKTRLMTQLLYVYHGELRQHVISTHKLLIPWNKHYNLLPTSAILCHSCFKPPSCVRPRPRVWVCTPASTA